MLAKRCVAAILSTVLAGLSAGPEACEALALSAPGRSGAATRVSVPHVPAAALAASVSGATPRASLGAVLGLGLTAPALGVRDAEIHAAPASHAAAALGAPQTLPSFIGAIAGPAASRPAALAAPAGEAGRAAPEPQPAAAPASEARTRRVLGLARRMGAALEAGAQDAALAPAAGAEGALAGRTSLPRESSASQAPRSLEPAKPDAGTQAGGAAPAAPPAAASADAEKPPSLLSRVVLLFLSNFLTVQVVLEATAVLVSQMTKPLKQGFIGLALLVAASQVAYVLGSTFGGRWVDRIGVRTSYRGVLILRTLIWTAFWHFFDPVTKSIALLPMILLFSADYFLHAISRLAEGKLKVKWFKSSPAKSNRFGVIRDFLDYGISFAMTAVTGLAIAAYGFEVIVIGAPIAFAVAALVSFLNREMPQSSPKKTKPMKLLDGFTVVLDRRHGILQPLLGWALINGFVFMFYFIISTSFGKFLVGEKEAAAAISGALVSSYGFGAMLAGVLNYFWITKKIEKAAAHPDEATQEANQSRLTVKAAAIALVAAALGMPLAWYFLKTGLLATVWGLPIYPIALALIPLALTSQIAYTLLETVWNDRIPKDQVDAMGGSIVGAARALSYGLIVALALLWGVVFQVLQAQAFTAVAAYCTLAAAAYLWLSRSLSKS
ncbi:MAG: MFS transporter [Elusimicrobia bacterium]|nr:MFS transporter [Elusimicrobiota bacterium]